MAAVIVHGGAYAIPDSIVEDSVKGCQSAARMAHKALLEGKPALDAGVCSKFIALPYLCRAFSSSS